MNAPVTPVRKRGRPRKGGDRPSTPMEPGTARRGRPPGSLGRALELAWEERKEYESNRLALKRHKNKLTARRSRGEVEAAVATLREALREVGAVDIDVNKQTTIMAAAAKIVEMKRLEHEMRAEIERVKEERANIPIGPVVPDRGPLPALFGFTPLEEPLNNLY